MNVNPLKYFPTTIFLTITMGLLLLSMATEILAGQGGNGQGGNGGGGGGNDTPDPDYSILASNSDLDGNTPGLMITEAACAASNPDLKGPGVAYLMFFERGCTAVTSDSVELDRLSIWVEQDDSGYLHTIEVRGETADGVTYSGFANVANQIIPPPDDANPDNDMQGFTLHVHAAAIAMQGCEKVKGKQLCYDAGTLAVDQLVYAFVSN